MSDHSRPIYYFLVVCFQLENNFLYGNKHLLIKEQHPQLDIRFVFVRADNKLSPKSKTTYGGWCEKNGFIYSEKFIPKEWFNEKN